MQLTVVYIVADGRYIDLNRTLRKLDAQSLQEPNKKAALQREQLYVGVNGRLLWRYGKDKSGTNIAPLFNIS